MFHHLASQIAGGGSALGSILYVLKVALSKAKLSFLPELSDEDVRELQLKHGYNEHSFVSVSVQPEIWRCQAPEGAVLYSERGRVWVVAGEPLGRAEDIARIAAEFVSFAKSQRKVVAFLPTTEKFAQSVISQGLRIVKVGAAPYFDLENWDPRGNSAKKLRVGVNRGRRSGVSVEELDKITKELRSEVDDLSAKWLESRRAGVGFGWLFELLPFAHSESKKYFAARGSDGEMVAFLAASPIPARDGWYLEDILRCPNAPEGATELLVFESLRLLASQGAKLATLGTVPLSEKGGVGVSVGNNFVLSNSLVYARRILNSMYNFDGLSHFKSKFVPSWWENEYVVVSRGHFIPPRVAHALLSIVVHGGIVKVLQILVSGESS